MCPEVHISVGPSSSPVGGRASGGLTGSRTAGMLARIPVEATFEARQAEWRPHGFPVAEDGRPIDAVYTCAAYVDNIFAVSTSAKDAIRILDDCEEQLSMEWGLTIKEDSREVMAAIGGSTEGTPQKMENC